MSYPFPEGAYNIVNYQNGNINTVSSGPVIPVVADPQAAVFTVADYKPLPGETLGFEVHHLVNIAKKGQPANLRLDNVLQSGTTPSDKGIVAIFDNAVPNVWCIHPSEDGETNKYLVYFSRYGTTDHGPFHWHLESSTKGTPVSVNIDQDHPINQTLNAHIRAGRGASLSDLTKKLSALAQHHPDCFWHFNKLN